MNTESPRAHREKSKWDGEAGTYDDWQGEYKDLYSEVTRRTIQALTPEARVVEIGCGTGLVTFAIASHVSQIKALDISEKMLDIARTKQDSDTDHVEFIAADAYDLPFEDGQFDVALCIYLLDIVETPEVVLREAYRVLKPSGRLISVTDAYGERGRVSTPRYMARELVSSAQRLMTGIGVWPRRPRQGKDWELLRLHNLAGFEPVEVAVFQSEEPTGYRCVYIDAVKHQPNRSALFE